MYSIPSMNLRLYTDVEIITEIGQMVFKKLQRRVGTRHTSEAPRTFFLKQIPEIQNQLVKGAA